MYHHILILRCGNTAGKNEFDEMWVLWVKTAPRVAELASHMFRLHSPEWRPFLEQQVILKAMCIIYLSELCPLIKVCVRLKSALLVLSWI